MELDCRPTDALALAICERVPIFLSEKLLLVGYVIKIKSGEEDPFEKWLRNLDADLFKYRCKKSASAAKAVRALRQASHYFLAD